MLTNGAKTVEQLELFPNRIREFQESVTPDLYDVRSFIEWEEMESRLRRYDDTMRFLKDLGSRGMLTVEILTDRLRTDPLLYEVVTLLLVIPNGVGFIDGRELPSPKRPLAGNHFEVAELLFDVGLPDFLRRSQDIPGQVSIAIIAQDALRRRYRVEHTVRERLHRMVDEVVKRASDEHNLILELVPDALWPSRSRGKPEYVLAVDQKPRIAIASVFQTASGGRQQYDLSIGY